MGVRLRRLFVFWLPCLMVAIGMGAIRFIDPWPVAPLRNAGFDLLQHTWPRVVPADADSPVVILDVDEQSLAQYGQWPWPRVLLAEIIDRLQAAGAVVIGLDTIFPEPDRMNPTQIAAYLGPLPDDVRLRLMAMPDGDVALAAAMKRSRTVLGSYVHWDKPSQSQSLRPRIAIQGPAASLYLPIAPSIVGSLPPLEAAAASVGVASFFSDDSVIRKVPLMFYHDGAYFPSFVVEILRVISRRPVILVSTDAAGVREVLVTPELRFPTDESGFLWPRFSIGKPTPSIRVRDLLQDPAAARQISGRIVILGTTASGLYHPIFTPVGWTTGVHLLARVLEAMLARDIISRPSYASAVEAVLAVLSAVLAALLLRIVRGGWRWPAGLFLAALPITFSVGIFLGKQMMFDGTLAAGAVFVVFAFGDMLLRLVPVGRSQPTDS